LEPFKGEEPLSVGVVYGCTVVMAVGTSQTRALIRATTAIRMTYPRLGRHLQNPLGRHLQNLRLRLGRRRLNLRPR